MSYFQLKYECMYCGTNFVVCTAMPEEFSVNTTYCPQCGHRGTSLFYQAIVPGSAEAFAPGDTPLTDVGRHILVVRNANTGLIAQCTLKPEVREHIRQGLNPDDIKA